MIKEILLINNAHIGDILFSQPLIKKFTNLNSDKYKISFFSLYNDFIFSDIKNLNIINKNNKYTKFLDNEYDHPELLLLNNIDLSFYKELHYHSHLLINNNETLMINTWIGKGLFQNYTKDNPECNITELHSCFKKSIDELNNIYNIDLKYDYSDEDLLIELPNVDINNFIEYKKTINKKIIFYYNYYPRSTQPGYTLEEHDEIILQLANKYKEMIIILAKPSKIKNICNNILDIINDFNCIETPSCENIVQAVNIAMSCDYVFSFEIGSCFYLINKDFNNKFIGEWYMIEINNKGRFYHLMFKHLKNSKIKLVYLHSKEEIKKII